MPGESENRVCDFCKRGRLEIAIEEIAFRQWSDKGYVHCRVEVRVGTCPRCGLRWLDPASDAMLEAAFRREYDKLP